MIELESPLCEDCVKSDWFPAYLRFQANMVKEEEKGTSVEVIEAKGEVEPTVGASPVSGVTRIAGAEANWRSYICHMYIQTSMMSRCPSSDHPCPESACVQVRPGSFHGWHCSISPCK